MGAAIAADRHLRRRRGSAGQRRDCLPSAECRYPLVGRQETADGRSVPRARRPARIGLPGCQCESDGNREYALSFQAGGSGLRQVPFLFVPLRDAGQGGVFHRRYRAVRCCGRACERRRYLCDGNDVARGCGRALQEKRHLAGKDAGRAGRIPAPHARGARDANGYRPDGGEGRRQVRGDVAPRPVAHAQ